MSDVFETAQEFGSLFSRCEHALKRGGFLRDDRKDAQANWRAFGGALGEPFFRQVLDSNLAETLILQPPGKLMRDGLVWQRPNRPLETSAELFEHGVCRVRNSLFHGEKFVGDGDQRERDSRLISEALDVLRAAIAEVPAIREQLG